MRLTNEYGAPDVFINVIEADPYDMGDADFSVTGLLQPPQLTRLRKDFRRRGLGERWARYRLQGHVSLHHDQGPQVRLGVATQSICVAFGKTRNRSKEPDHRCDMQGLDEEQGW